MGGLAVVNSLATVLSLSFLLTRTGNLSTVELSVAYFVAAVPFFLSGTVLSLIISETVERVNKTYFFDLLGAAAGCLVLVPLLNWLGGPETILVAGVLFAVSAAIWFHLGSSNRGRAMAVALGLLLVALITVNSKMPLIDVKYAKGQRLTGEEFVQWNSFSRIALKPEPGSGMKSIVIDADASTGIAQFDFNHLTPQQKGDLTYQGPGIPYLLRPGAKALIIGPGGGWDVARALASGSKDVTGVEINPIIAKTIMRNRFSQYSNRLYFRPDVRIFVEDGRSFVRRSEEQYDVLQATLVDTWASTAAGAFALSENNLYTTEAFVDYLSHLRPDGVLAFTRWGFIPPRESLRVVSLAQAALAQLGQPSAAANIIVVREFVANINAWGARDTILIARNPFTPLDLQHLQDGAGKGRMQIVYAPGLSTNTPFRQLLESKDRESFFANYAFDVRPVSDDRPFFFYTVQPRDLMKFVTSASHDTADYKVNSALPVLFGLLGVSFVATIIIMALPPVLLGSRLPRSAGSWRSLLFFLCIGAGYILIQVALIQKFVLFLGHPTYALTVIIFSMLLSSGAGSFASKRVIAGDPRRLAVTLLFITAMITVLSFTATPIAESGVQLPLSIKMLLSVALISPAGFAMGMPFPTGLGLLEATMPSAIRWAWAVNAAASVLGSAAAMFLAIYLGLSSTLLIGGVLYIGALLSFLSSPLRQHHAIFSVNRDPIR